MNSIGKRIVDNISEKVLGKIVNSAKDFIIKLSLFIVILVSSMIFAIFGLVRILANFEIFESGLFFLIIGITLFCSSFIILKSIYE